MKPFLILYAVFVLATLALLITIPKEESFLLLNGVHTGFGDALFPYLTYLGGGALSLIVVLVLPGRSYKWTIISASSFILSGAVTQILKRTLFADAKRPMNFFQDNTVVETVQGVEIWMHNSFPSGHSATAFSVFFLLSLLLKGKQQLWGVLFFILALLGGYSRIYLGQHFPEDVLAGSVIGVVVTLLCYLLLYKRLSKMPWANRGWIRRG